jgi:hypothetical protein
MHKRPIALFALPLIASILAGCVGPDHGITIPEVIPPRPESLPPPEPPPPPPPPPTPMIQLPPKAQWTAHVSGVQEPAFPGSHAIDGNTGTRWSSPAEDPQWIQVDMGASGTLCGLTILWETAYTKEYEIKTSPDGQLWETVYRTDLGDGRTDIVAFKPTVCRFFKIIGYKRGTGWGHSIWEIDAHGPADRQVARAPAAKGSDAALAIDGRPETAWTAPIGGAMQFEIDLQKPRGFGGVRIDWGTNHATEATLETSQNGASWKPVASLTRGTGKFDLLLHASTEARYVRLNIKATANDAPAVIREISLKGPDEMPTASTLYEVAAEKARPGLYPEQFRKRQVYWTVMGLPDDRVESLLDEYGNLEPINNGFSVAPFVYINDKLHSALDAKKLRQELEKGYLPMPRVTWDLETVQLQVQAYTHGTASNATTYARYILRNTSATIATGKLYLAIRPVQINPPWQYGGLSPIKSMAFTNKDEGATIRVNNADKIVSLMMPSGFGARAFDMGDVVEDLQQGRLPGQLKVDNAGDLISGALAYEFRLLPGQEVSTIIAAPLHGTKDDIVNLEQMTFVENVDPIRALQNAFDFRMESLKKFWDARIGDAVIDIPDKDVANTIRSQIAYILINRDGPAIQPGSRNYNRSWMRDGSMTSVSMLRMGVVEPVREFIEWYTPRITPAGLVPPILDNNGQVNTGFGSNLEYDSQGQYLYLIMEYYRLTGDRTFLEEHFDAMHRAMKFMVTLRERTMAPDHMAGEPARERFYGILPPSISHEGYSTPVHSYWDDFFALRGWKDGAAAAEELGHAEIAAWAREQYEALKASVRTSLNATIQHFNIRYIPGCAEKGDMDATSTAIAISPCYELDVMPRKELDTTFDMYYADLERRAQPGWESTYTPYELRSITAFIALGHPERGAKLLDYLMGHRRPLGFNHLAEVVMGDERKGGYIGDMPHTWVGSGLVNAVREMIVDEQGGKLVVLNGVPPDWLTRGNGVRVECLPTHFGRLDLTASAKDKTLTVKLGGTLDAPKGISLHWPFPGAPARVAVDGQPWTSFDERECRFGNEVKEIVAEW